MWASNTLQRTKPHDQSPVPHACAQKRLHVFLLIEFPQMIFFCIHACSPFVHFTLLANSGVHNLQSSSTDAKMPLLHWQQYSAAFKWQVMIYAQSASNVEAGPRFDAPEKYVREWTKQKTKISTYAATHRSLCEPKSGRYNTTEEVVRDWVHDQRSKSLSVFYDFIEVKARTVVINMRIPLAEFKTELFE